MPPLSTAPVQPTLDVGARDLRIEDVLALAEGRARPRLASGVRERMQQSHALVQARLAEGARIYGVTTGYGDSVRTDVPSTNSADLSLHLIRFHGCGTGRTLEPVESAAVLAVRLCSLVAGFSGIEPEVAQRLCTLLERRILPAIPAEGSVGASGDLTPLSYVAAVLVGEREVLAPNAPRPAAQVLAEHGLSPLRLGPKAALALMNGTSVATALGVIAFGRAQRLARLAARITAVVSRAIGGNPEHFESVIHQAKGHRGQVEAAGWIRDELDDLGRELGPAPTPSRLQDRYSVRCAPHVLGVLVDALHWSRQVIETELNGVSDNPLVDVEHERIVHGGNFYGGHIGFVMDALKTAVANVADLLDRQLVLLCRPEESAGLPANLVGADGDVRTYHGFKAMSISASALTAEALKLTMPASVFSRSTESHNQDKVPMATIASRDALRVLQLSEQVAAIGTLAACQAIELRAKEHDSSGSLHAAVRAVVPPLREDRRMDGDIAAVMTLIGSNALTPEVPCP
ncbi:MAG: aromatic amino acid ammonia-lyase [Myxococcota bacterium]